MLSLNRYRLKYRVKKKDKAAIRVNNLLERPDRLIGVILIGNNLANILMTIVASIITTHFFGEWVTVTIMPVVLTLLVLIFAEVTPKTIAALHPEKIAYPASVLLKPLLWVLYPIVFAINAISNTLSKMIGVETTQKSLAENLRPEELRTVVGEAGDLIPDKHQGIMLNVLDLDTATVEDVMIPRNDVVGIDIDHAIPDILKHIRETEHTRLPVFQEGINDIKGVLHLRKASRFLYKDDEDVTLDDIMAQVTPPYFIPESTSLTAQLMYFQKERRRMAIVVDEYGDVQGIVSLVDILEEIVGDLNPEFAQQITTRISKNTFSVDASASIRDVNRQLNISLATDGPKTLNGLIVEYLESIPDAPVSFKLADHEFEITELTETKIVRCIIRISDDSE